MKRKASWSITPETNSKIFCSQKENLNDTSTCNQHYLPCVNNRGYTNLHISAKTGNVAECKQIIDSQPATITACDNLGNLPLDLAIKGDHLEAFKVIKEVMSAQEIYACRAHGSTVLQMIAKQDKIAKGQIEMAGVTFFL